MINLIYLFNICFNTNTCDDLITNIRKNNCSIHCHDASNPLNFSLIHNKGEDNIISTEFISSNNEYQHNFTISNNLANMCPEFLYKLGRMCLLYIDTSEYCFEYNNYFIIGLGIFVSIAFVIFLVHLVRKVQKILREI